MKNNKVYILTAVHNEINDTKKLFQCIYNQTYKNLEVYLIDDGSTDGTANFISEKYPQVKMFKGDGNLWWTASLNLGLKSILKKANVNDYIWIVNNDCYFSEDILENLYNFSSKHSKSIIGSLILDSETKRVWDSGVKIDWKNFKFTSGGTDALSTKGTLYPVQVFKEIGLFDAKHFPHYFSDYEFSIRAKRNGYKLLICPSSSIFNKTKRTGVGDKISSKWSLMEIMEILFSKRSKVNLRVNFNMIRFVCPKKYRIKNYFYLIKKIIKNGAKQVINYFK